MPTQSTRYPETEKINWIIRYYETKSEGFQFIERVSLFKIISEPMMFLDTWPEPTIPGSVSYR